MMPDVFSETAQPADRSPDRLERWFTRIGRQRTDQRHPSRAALPAETASTRLGRGLMDQSAGHPGLTGILPLADANEAFVARMLLARTAERTLDVQYYIWNSDITGTLLLQALYQAAERGVRVRLLLDDNGTAGMDQVLAALNVHPLIEIRLFNPFSVRWPKLLGYVTNFRRANRRMHNKSMTADNQATIVGGRNVGDEYFGATHGVHFTDLDVLAVGAVVSDVSDDFDRYWACESAWSLDRVVKAATQADLLAEVARAAAAAEKPKARQYLQALTTCGIINDLASGSLDLQWSKVVMVSDDPCKGMGETADSKLMIFRLKDVLGEPDRQLDLVSPYFVPTRSGVSAFTALVQQQVKVRILTNALEATDVAAVHAGYARRRKALLKAGVTLYEMRRQNNDVRRRNAGPFGSSGSSLHAKTFSVDNRRAFVGSFNFDPRSARLNTEMGFVIDSPDLAAAITDAFAKEVPGTAYQACLDARGKLYWLENKQGQIVRHNSEPGTGPVKRALIGVLSHLPIEWLL